MPASDTRSIQSCRSRSYVPHATWWTTPALWRPRSSGAGSKAIQPPRRSPRNSKRSPERRAPISCSSTIADASGFAL